ncbi:MAG TPA: hypothetical protein VIS48_16720 [Candidatus Kryptonia bacterium]
MNKTVLSISLAAALLLFGCAKGSNPVSQDGTSHTFYGQVLDSQGKPLEGVAIHYMFTTEPNSLYKLDKTCPSTIIGYTVPRRCHVTVTLLRWFTLDSIATLVDDTLNAGEYMVTVDGLSATNGVYICRVVADTSVSEFKIALENLDYSVLIKKTPLTTTDSNGKFSLPYGIFAFGVPFVLTNGVNPIDTVYMSRTIEFVLYKSGYQTAVQSVTIDTTTDMNQQFHLAQ